MSNTRLEFEEEEEEEEEEEDWDPLVEQFGDIALVTAVRDPQRVRQLLAAGKTVVPNAIFAAIWVGNLETLQLLVSAGGNLNTRFNGCTNISVSSEEWLNTQVTSTFGVDEQEWLPLLQAASKSGRSAYDRAQRTEIISWLLEQGADLYALYPQPLRKPGWLYVPNETCAQQQFEEGGSESESEEDTYLYGKGIRCVIHSMLEDGYSVAPILDSSKVLLNLEHEDPQGRTVLLAACRNPAGVDIDIDGTVSEISWNTEDKYYDRVPFTTTPDRPSLFRHLLQRGANPLATDHLGKHILHHLLEASDARFGRRPPQIQTSLKYVLSNFPSLINQADHNGTYPLHAALQRWRRYPIRNLYTDLVGLESVVEDLLAAGADPLVTDGYGNTALHYIADNGLIEEVHGEHQRRVFRLFVEYGVDVNMRNVSGQTALELAVDDDGLRSKLHLMEYLITYSSGKHPSAKDVTVEVFDMFETAGVRWLDRNTHGQTLLHLVARNPMWKSAFRAECLLGKGVDPFLRDETGKTALDVAEESNNIEVVEMLKKSIV